MDIRKLNNGRFFAVRWHGTFCCWKTFRSYRAAEAWISSV